MKHSFKKLFARAALVGALACALALTGCGKHPVSESVEIGAAETAFLVSLEGDTANKQLKFDSLAALKATQQGIAVKRVIIPHKIIDLCPECWGSPEKQIDVPLARLFKVNRALVSREWTPKATTGTSTKDQSIVVESRESIDFSVGVTVTAHIAEPDAALFLYSFADHQLEEVIDRNVRPFVSRSLFSKFGTHSLEEGQLNKVHYINEVEAEARAFFAKYGITIDNLGMSQGMTYTDEKVQMAINNKFAAQKQAEAAVDLAKAASLLVANRDAVLMQQDYDLKRLALTNQSQAIVKWNGVGPQAVMGGAGQLFNLPAVVAHTK